MDKYAFFNFFVSVCCHCEYLQSTIFIILVYVICFFYTFLNAIYLNLSDMCMLIYWCRNDIKMHVFFRGKSAGGNKICGRHRLLEVLCWQPYFLGMWGRFRFRSWTACVGGSLSFSIHSFPDLKWPLETTICSIGEIYIYWWLHISFPDGHRVAPKRILFQEKWF